MGRSFGTCKMLTTGLKYKRDKRKGIKEKKHTQKKTENKKEKRSRGKEHIETLRLFPFISKSKMY